MPKDSGKRSDLLDHLDELVEELHQNVPKALEDWDGEAIHDARVATRRLKAALELLRFVLNDDHRDAFAKMLKRVRRRLGRLRDLDVMIQHAEELARIPAHASAAGWLCQQLICQRDRAREKTRRKAVPADLLEKLGTWYDVRREIDEAHEAIDSLLSESLHLQLDAFSERADAISAQSTVPPDGSPPQDPHQLRIAGKLLRYTLEHAQAQGHKLPASVLRGFKRMQEALGTWHDYVVLLECAMDTAVDEDLALHNPELLSDVLDLCRALLKRAHREVRRFAQLWQKHGEQVTRTIREKFPLTRSVSEPQTGPGPSGSDHTPVPVALPPDAVSSA